MSTLVLLLVSLLISTNSRAEGLYLKELAEGINSLTKGSLFFPDRCLQLPTNNPITLSDHPDCSNRLNAVQAAIKNENNESTIQNLIKSKNPKLVLIGEGHGSPPAVTKAPPPRT